MKREVSRRDVLKSTAAGAALTSLWTGSGRSARDETGRANAAGVESGRKIKRPNILWIVGENLKLDLGCYGAKNVHTPNLDALAADGMRYTHAFSTSPVCAPSRSAFFVGMYQTTCDTHNMRSHRDDDYRLPEGVRPITHRLKDAGYFTANIKTMAGEVVGSGKLDLNFVNEGRLYDGDQWEDLKEHQPFFAQVNTLEAEYDIYDRQTWRQPRVEWKGERTHEKIATPDNVTPPPYYPDHPLVREEWARYLNSISGMDRTVGKILRQLEADGLADDTIVMFFGDNGRIEPRGIHWCYDTGLHVPLIVHIPGNVAKPGNYKPGTVSNEVISLIDITPTTLSFAGIERPKAMDGRIFLGDRLTPERQYAFSARDRIDETVNRIRSVRGKRYHYIRNYYPDRHFTSLNRYKEKCFPIKPLMRQLMAEGKLTGPPAELMSPTVAPEQLFDTVNDPHEIHNLADSDEPQHREALIRMRTALSVWMVETQDQGVFPEPEDVVRPFEKEMHDWFGTPDWHRK
ncbi:MAG: sulfatase-like hydrolase/transferase [Sedimentisphaerales bacterium]|nr:sulfatase-like hydrolase/transferase [Sedimentisphaerales bacterium]